MSAQQFYQNNAHPYLPYLPLELWGMIIQHATLVPGGYDPELTTLALGINANTMNKERLKAWKMALVTRRTLVRVSKTWYALASPFLYEYILLGRGMVVPTLLYAMQRSQQGIQSGDTSRPAIGWWTKRLDINFRDCASDPEAVMQALADVMPYLPNLRVLTFSITGHKYQYRLPPTVLKSVSCRETLKFVHFYYNNCLPSNEAWAHFLKQHPYLESVNLNDRFFSGRLFYTRLGRLQTVHIDPDTTYPLEISADDPSWSTNFPAVRAATYDLKSANSEMRAEQFFTNFGPKLSTIQLSQLHLDQDTNVELEANLQMTFDRIVSKCPALEQINLLFCSWSILTLFVPHLPSKVTTLVIRIIKGQISKKMTTRLFHEILVAMKGRNPNLKTIQFSSGMNVEGLRIHSKALAGALRRMSDIGLVIKDAEGCVMI